MSQNKGTLITSTIRPNDTNTPISVAYATELMGGHQSYATLIERDSIILARRSWGMVVSIYNDFISDNNKTYILQYGHYDSDITNNLNWIPYNSLGVHISSDWVDSVLNVIIGVTSANNGDRFLVDHSPDLAGIFASYSDYIVEYDSSSITNWIYHQPTNGMTLRIDNINNVIYKYNGSYSTGLWKKEHINQVRYITATSFDGLTYYASSQNVTSIDCYSQSVYYVNFGKTNSGAVTLSVDNKYNISVEKLSSNNLLPLSSNDLVPNVIYQLTYNNTNDKLQTYIQSNQGSIGSNSSNGSTYSGLTDLNISQVGSGLFTFNSSTPIGTTIDLFNQTLLALVPSPAPNLRNWSATGSFTTGKLSFNNTTNGYQTATQSSYLSTDINSTFTSSTFNGYRLGIMSNNSTNNYYTDIAGILNNDVISNIQLPTPAYTTYSFGNGNHGTMSLYLNGITISSIGLSNISATDSTSNYTLSGLSFSSATTSLFASGYPFSVFYNRIGTYIIKKNDNRILNGYNYISLKHVSTSSFTVSVYEFINDPDNTTLTSLPILNPSLVGYTTKYLSGIQYYTNISSYVTLLANVNNVYRSTYYPNSDGILYQDISVTNPVNGVYGFVNTNSSNGGVFLPYISQQYIPVCTSTASILSLNMTYSLLNNKRRINDSITFSITIKKTVQNPNSYTFNGTLTNLFIDTYNSTSSNTTEIFVDELYRLQNAISKYDTYITNTSDISLYGWSSSQSIMPLLLTTNRYNDGLQIINSNLIYPKFSFNVVGSLSTNPNYNSLYTDYSNYGAYSSGMATYSASNNSTNRTYTRYFNLGTDVSYYNALLNISYNGILNFVTSTTNLSGNNAWVEIKLPYNSGIAPKGLHSGAVTGWLDCSLISSNPGLTSSYDDGNGCLNQTTVPTSSGGNWNVTFGAQSTYYSGGYVLFRITTSSNWNGSISSVIMNGV